MYIHKLSGKVGQGLEMMVDDEDKDLFINKKISVSNGYCMMWKDGTIKYVHRVIMNPQNGEHIDHINGNKRDNRRCNLRLCTQQQNLMNRKHRFDSNNKYKCIKKLDSGKFCIRMKHNKKTYYKTLQTEAEAIEYYNTKARELYGEFAKLIEVNK